MTPNSVFYRNKYFIETLLKHFCLEMSPFVSGRGSQRHTMVNWLQMSLNETVLVIPAGFEPTTHRLEICCSIQLSYGTKIGGCRGRQIRTADLHVPNVAR